MRLLVAGSGVGSNTVTVPPARRFMVPELRPPSFPMRISAFGDVKLTGVPSTELPVPLKVSVQWAQKGNTKTLVARPEPSGRPI